MYQTTYYVEKKTDTFADTLLAYGLASLLDRLAYQAKQKASIYIEDMGSCYTICLDKSIEKSWLSNNLKFDVIPYIFFKKEDISIPKGCSFVIDYEQEKKRESEYFEIKKRTNKELINSSKPRLDWGLCKAINIMSAGATYQKLLMLWYNESHTNQEVFNLILQMYCCFPNQHPNKKTLPKSLLQNVNMLQIINPSRGKGYSRTKADGVSISAMKNIWVEEFLKFIGFFEAGISFTPSGTKDRKTYVLLPKKIKLNDHRRIFKKFRENLFSSSSIKLDVLTSLKYTQSLLSYCEENQKNSLAKRLGTSLSNIISGFSRTYYKNLGSAVATINQAQINLPGWMNIKNSNDVKEYQSVLDEHKKIISTLSEQKNQCYSMLSSYRDFLSTRSMELFYDFSNSYARYVMQQMLGRSFVYTFLPKNLRRIIVGTNPNLSQILDNRGFQNISYAIRYSTVVLQYRKSQKKENYYTIRYGLGDTLTRKAKYKNEFLDELSKFMHSFNKENVQVAETQGKQYRRNITIEDIRDITTLLDHFCCKTVGSLLVACGYARDLKENQKINNEITNS